jgi:hypothetical protein
LERHLLCYSFPSIHLPLLRFFSLMKVWHYFSFPEFTLKLTRLRWGWRWGGG